MRRPRAQKVAPVTAFETGVNRWQTMNAWPVAPAMKPLYLEVRIQAGLGCGTC